MYGDGEIELYVLSMAALLHDVDQPYNDKKNHVEKSLERAENILRDLGYPENKMRRVLEAIAEHSSVGDFQPMSIEAKVLFDADKLDGLGDIGISRFYRLFWSAGSSTLRGPGVVPG